MAAAASKALAEVLTARGAADYLDTPEAYWIKLLERDVSKHPRP